MAIKKTTKQSREKKIDRSDPMGPIALCGKRLGVCDDPLHHQKICSKCIRIIKKDEEEYEKDFSNKQLMLFPELPESLRAVPNTIVRSALFRVTDKRIPRKYIDRKKPEIVAALKGISMKYSGPDLRQDDEDILLEIYKICHKAGRIDDVPFIARQMLMAIKWNDDGKSYDRLNLILGYLSDGNIQVQTTREWFSGKLIRKLRARDKNKKDPGSREYRVWLEPEIARLFAAWTAIDFEQRLNLHSSLAKAIHSHLSTHDDPYSYSVNLWKTLSGSNTKALFSFRQQLKIALNELVKAGFLQAWNIDKKRDLVHVVRAVRPDPRQLELPSDK